MLECKANQPVLILQMFSSDLKWVSFRLNYFEQLGFIVILGEKSSAKGTEFHRFDKLKYEPEIHHIGFVPPCDILTQLLNGSLWISKDQLLNLRLMVCCGEQLTQRYMDLRFSQSVGEVM